MIKGFLAASALCIMPGYIFYSDHMFENDLYLKRLHSMHANREDFLKKISLPPVRSVFEDEQYHIACLIIEQEEYARRTWVEKIFIRPPMPIL